MEYSQNNNGKQLCSLDNSKIIDCESIENSIGISLCRLLRLSMALLCVCLIFSHTNTSRSVSKEAYEARQADSLALVELYHATGGENWNIKWNLNEPLEKWHGVTLCKLGRSVNSIDLDGVPDNTAKSKGGNNLQGELPDLQLPNLIRLYLGSNNLTGTLPDFTGLQKATVISLSSNNISGQIPEFTHLKSLERFELDYNEVEGTIPTFAACPKLRFLYLPHNNLHGDIPKFNLPKLRVLLLQNNDLEGTVPDLCQLKKLNHLNISDNNLSELWDLRRLNSLDKLIVARNRFDFAQLVPNAKFFTKPEDYQEQHPEYSDALIFKALQENYRMDLPLEYTNRNEYNWYKNDEQYKIKTSEKHLTFDALSEQDAGIYYAKITNPELPGLTITSGLLSLHVEEGLTPKNTPVLSDVELVISGKITPNGDGKNDLFTVNSTRGQVNLEDSQLEVFNGSGQLVYQAAPYQNNWQGTFMQSGESLPAGAYFYRFILDKTKNHLKSGTVVIIK